MDRAPISDDQQFEATEVSHEDRAIEGLESHAAEEAGVGVGATETETPGVNQEALAESAEHGAHGPHGPEGHEATAPGNAVSAIDPKISAARTKMRDRHEKSRLKQQKARIANRKRGNDWTAEVL